MDQDIVRLARNHQSTEFNTKFATYTSLFDNNVNLPITEMEVPLLDTISGEDLIEVSMASLTTQWRPEPFITSELVYLPYQLFQCVTFMGPNGSFYQLSNLPSKPIIDMLPGTNPGTSISTIIIQPTAKISEGNLVIPPNVSFADQQTSLQYLGSLINDEVRVKNFWDYDYWFNQIVLGPSSGVYLSSPALADVFQNNKNIGRYFVKGGRPGIKTFGFQPFAWLQQSTAYNSGMFDSGPVPFGYAGVFWMLTFDFFDQEPFTIYTFHYYGDNPNGLNYYGRIPDVNKMKLAKQFGYPHDIIVPYDLIDLANNNTTGTDEITALRAAWQNRSLVYDLLGTGWNSPPYLYPGQTTSSLYSFRPMAPTYVGLSTFTRLLNSLDWNQSANLFIKIYRVNLPDNDAAELFLENCKQNITPIFTQVNTRQYSANGTPAVWLEYQKDGLPLKQAIVAGTIPINSEDSEAVFINLINYIICYYTTDEERSIYRNQYSISYPPYVPDYFLEDKELNLVLADDRWSVFGGAVINGEEINLLQTIFMTQANAFGAYQQTSSFDAGSTVFITGVSNAEAVKFNNGGSSAFDTRYIQGFANDTTNSCILGAIGIAYPPSNFMNVSVANFSGLQAFTQAQPITLIMTPRGGEQLRSIKFVLLNSNREPITAIGLSSSQKPSTQLVISYKVFAGRYSLYQHAIQGPRPGGPMGFIMPLARPSSGPLNRLSTFRRRAIKRRARRVAS